MGAAMELASGSPATVRSRSRGSSAAIAKAGICPVPTLSRRSSKSACPCSAARMPGRGSRRSGKSASRISQVNINSARKKGSAHAQTEKNLKEAFAGESQANRKYLTFAAKADQLSPGRAAVPRRGRGGDDPRPQPPAGTEGHPQHEGEPRRGHRRRNARIQEHVSGHDRTGEGGGRRGRRAVLHLRERGGEDPRGPLPGDPVCGFTAEKEAPETCPVCGAKGKMFKRID